jgi:Yip1 domain
MEQVNHPKPRTTPHGLVNRVRNILLNPNAEWDVIALETPDRNRIMAGYVVPLAGLAALAALIGFSLIGVSIFGVRTFGFSYGIYVAIRIFINALITVYIASLIVDNLAPSFASERNMGRSMQLVAYSFTPVWIGGLLAIIPALAIIGGLFGLYGLYLMYLGIPKLKHTPADRHVGYFVVSLLVTIVVFAVIGWIISMLFVNIFGWGYHGFDFY